MRGCRPEGLVRDSWASTLSSSADSCASLARDPSPLQGSSSTHKGHTSAITAGFVHNSGDELGDAEQGNHGVLTFWSAAQQPHNSTHYSQQGVSSGRWSPHPLPL